MNVDNRPAGSPYFSLSTADSWHGAHVASATRARDTGESGSDGERMPCSPWHVVHTGMSVSPCAARRPWIPSR